MICPKGPSYSGAQVDRALLLWCLGSVVLLFWHKGATAVIAWGAWPSCAALSHRWHETAAISWLDEGKWPSLTTQSLTPPEFTFNIPSKKCTPQFYIANLLKEVNSAGPRPGIWEVGSNAFTLAEVLKRGMLDSGRMVSMMV